MEPKKFVIEWDGGSDIAMRMMDCTCNDIAGVLISIADANKDFDWIIHQAVGVMLSKRGYAVSKRITSAWFDYHFKRPKRNKNKQHDGDEL